MLRAEHEAICYSPDTRRKIMSRKLLSIITTALLINVMGVLPAAAQTPSAKELLRTSKLKAKVESFGPRTLVIVELADGANLKGYVSSVTDDGFAVADARNGASIAVAYAEVKDVRKKPSTAFLAAEVAAAVGAGAGMLYLFGYALSKCSVCID
jgi:hypothetical protein